jgi:hypothetical protein
MENCVRPTVARRRIVGGELDLAVGCVAERLVLGVAAAAESDDLALESELAAGGVDELEGA